MNSGTTVALIQRAFPFHIEFDDQLIVHSLGERLAARLGDVQGRKLSELFHAERPISLFDGDVEEMLSLFVLLQEKNSEQPLRLKGEMVASGDDRYIFLCEPWVRSLDELSALGLGIGDLAAHSGVADLLYLIHAKDKSITSMREMRSLLQEQKQELQQEKDRAEQASAAKTDFLATVSHEIRTPMNAILGMLELARQIETDPVCDDYLRRAQSNAGALLTLINDLLSVSKIEAGALELSNTSVELHDICDLVAGDLYERAASKNVAFRCVLEPEIPRSVTADPDAIRRVLVNLIGNAIKFTSEGEVELRVSRMHQNAERVELDFSIRDTGIGISAEAQKKIFERFVQADSGTQREFGGTGLGLSITQHLVEASGGKIWVESTEGQGSIFRCKIPFEILDSTPWIDREPGALAKRVAVCCDDFSKRRELETLIRFRGHQLSMSLDERPDFAVVLAPFAGEIPEGQSVIYLGSGPPHVAATSVSASVVDVLRRIERPRRKRTRTITERPRQHKRVLVVDDHSDNRVFVRECLEREGYEVVEAEDGQQAVEKTMTDHFDLVLMDIEMPNMDGFEATVAIREAEYQNVGSLVPVVALTAHAVEGFPEKCIRTGMSGYASKPIQRDALLELAEEWTQRAPRIMFVDDQETNRMLYATLAARFGRYRISLARDGLHALEIANTRRFDAIWLDLEMPRMGGLEAAEHLRSGPLTEGPIVALTGHDADRVMPQCRAAGFTAHLQKPIAATHLRESLDRYAPSDPPLAMISSRPGPAPLAAPKPATNGKAKLEPGEGEIWVDLDEDVADLSIRYLGKQEAELRALNEGLVTSDLEAIRSIGHKLKGSGAAHGFAFITDIGRELERYGEQGQYEEAKGAVERFASYLSRVRIRE